MNGHNNAAFVFDTNVIIDFINNKIASLPAGERFISVITEMELCAAAGLSSDEEHAVNEFLDNVTVIPLIDDVKQEAIQIRKLGKPRLKLPDAIVAATALIFNASLATSDERIHKLNWSCLRATLNKSQQTRIWHPKQLKTLKQGSQTAVSSGEKAVFPGFPPIRADLSRL